MEGVKGTAKSSLPYNENTVSIAVVCREQDSSPTGVTLKCVKDPFTRKGLISNLAKRTFIIAKLFLVLCMFYNILEMKLKEIKELNFKT